jgi:hypothetical protein
LVVAAGVLAVAPMGGRASASTGSVQVPEVASVPVSAVPVRADGGSSSVDAAAEVAPPVVVWPAGGSATVAVGSAPGSGAGVGLVAGRGGPGRWVGWWCRPGRVGPARLRPGHRRPRRGRRRWRLVVGRRLRCPRW